MGSIDNQGRRHFQIKLKTAEPSSAAEMLGTSHIVSKNQHEPAFAAKVRTRHVSICLPEKALLPETVKTGIKNCPSLE